MMTSFSSICLKNQPKLNKKGGSEINTNLTQNQAQKSKETLLKRSNLQNKLNLLVDHLFLYILQDEELCGYYIIEVNNFDRLQEHFKGHLQGLLTKGKEFFANKELQRIHQRVFQRQLIIREKQFNLLWHYLQRTMKEFDVNADCLEQFKDIFYSLAPRVMNIESRAKKAQERNSRLKQKRQRLAKMYEKAENQDEAEENSQKQRKSL